MNHDNNEPTVKVSARRRLVRGVFAAPAALTLYSGGAFAATSMTCVAKEVAGRTEAPGNPTDAYLRVQLWTLAGGNPGNTPSSWVKGSEVRELMKNGSYITSDSHWQCYFVGAPAQKVKIGTNNFDLEAGKVYDGEPNNGNDIPVKSTVAPVYVALRVDTTGKIVGVQGVVASTAPANAAIHTSCWSSFKPVP